MSQSKALIVASVQRNFERMDLENDGFVTKFEWLHAALLELHPPDAVNAEIITKQIKKRPELVEQLVCRWLEVDEKAVWPGDPEIAPLDFPELSVRKPFDRCHT